MQIDKVVRLNPEMGSVILLDESNAENSKWRCRSAGGRAFLTWSVSGLFLADAELCLTPGCPVSCRWVVRQLKCCSEWEWCLCPASGMGVDWPASRELLVSALDDSCPVRAVEVQVGDRIVTLNQKTPIE